MSKITLGICSDWLNGNGIMSVLTNNFDVPWAGTIDGQTLDDDYYGNRSGNKIIAPLVQKFVSEDGITDEKMIRLARVIFAKYGEGWNRAFLALSKEYDPLENYNGIEETTEEHGKKKKTLNKGKQTNKETFGEYDFTKGEQNDEIDDGQHEDELTIGQRKETVENGIQGFNSNDYSDADKSERTNNSATDKNKYGQHLTKTKDGERVDTYGERINEFEDGSRVDTDEDDAYTDKITLNRHGNLGVTTSQQMLISELDMRRQYTLMDSLVFPNVDAVMCLNIFGECDLTLDDFTIKTDYVLPTATANRLGGVKIGSGITVQADGTISVSGFVTADELATALQPYITATQLETTLGSYATTTALATKQNLLVSGQNIKTINGESILGSGDITIQGGGDGLKNIFDKSRVTVYNHKFINTSSPIPTFVDTSEAVTLIEIDVSDLDLKIMYTFAVVLPSFNRLRIAVSDHNIASNIQPTIRGSLIISTVSESYSTAQYSIGTINNQMGNTPFTISIAANGVHMPTILPQNSKYFYIYLVSGIGYTVDDIISGILIAE